MKPLDHKAEVLAHRRVNERVMLMELAFPASPAVPGQFVMVKTGLGDDPLLRRPISIHRRTRNGIELLYEIVGQGTSWLSESSPGASLSVIGPLGNGFPLAAAKGRIPVLVGGGIGAAPLVFLAEKLVASDSGKKPVVLLGARSRSDLLCADDFRSAGCKVVVATDDGSCGRRGFVSCLLADLCADAATGKSVIYSCGPRPMLNSISSLAGAAGIPAYVSLEAHMACGIGACLGCIVATNEGNKRVCKDGPVFDAQDILWGQSDEN
jgi:dihydroorotate dehydrogenase electron transfer subunit